MLALKDVFISYGRKESKAFAARLHDTLKDAGYNAWFDQNDIPLGVDFQNQIDDGINQAHNFVFVIAPHALRSPYCLKEIELAIQMRKRIIPILHVEPKSQEVWDMMHPTISKLNWIYMREKYEEGKALEELEALDSFEEGIAGLKSIIDSHKKYVTKHTELLCKALEWQNFQEATEYLLVGQDRQKAEEWLLTQFKTEQPPCEPAELHCEYIAESKKNGENMMCDAFMSFASEDRKIKEKVINSLARYGITSWSHARDVKKGMSFEKAIYEGIEQSDNFLYFLSSNSIKSEWCHKEIEYAVALNKRIIPLRVENVPKGEIPEAIANLQYIDFTDNIEDRELGRNERSDFDQDIDDILFELKADERYYHQHKVFLAQALKWQRQGKNPSILLRGYNLQNAQAWLTIGLKREIGKPLPIHEEFIAESAANAGDLVTEVFVSYSRGDGDFARKINEELQLNGKTTWFDQDSIAEGSDFQREIYKGIETSENFVFIISPRSINSPYCADEVAYAAKQNKRFITLLYEPTEVETIPSELSAVQWIDFVQLDHHTAFSQLIRTLNTDREHIQNHSKWQNIALNWEAKGKTDDLLLRGSEYSLADAWLKEALEQQKNPSPTTLQKEFIKASETAILAVGELEKRRVKRLKLLLTFMVFAFIVAIAGFIFSFFLREEALEAKKDAESQTEIAKKQSQIAKENERAAREEKLKAEKATQEALEAKEQQAIEAENAKIAEQKANEETVNARKAEKVAQQEAENARVAEQKAKESEKVATKALEDTKKAQKEREEIQKKSLYYLYEFNAKELAMRSISTDDDNNFKARLALTSYELMTEANTNVADNASSKYDAEILESLQKASLPFNNSVLQPGEVWAMDASNGSVAYSKKAGEISFAQIKTNGSILAPFREAKTIKIDETSLEKERKSILEKYVNLFGRSSKIDGKLGNSDAFVRSLALNPQTGDILFGTASGDVFYNPKSSNEITMLFNHSLKSVVDVDFISQNNSFVSVGRDGNVFLGSLSNPSEGSLLNTNGAINTLVVTQNSVVGASEDGGLYQWDLASKTMSTLYKGDTPIRSLAYDKNTNSIAIGRADGTIMIGKLNNQLTMLPFSRHHEGVTANVNFSPDGQWLATIGLEGVAYLWNLKEGFESLKSSLPVNIENGNRKIFSIAFDPESKYIIFGDNKSLSSRPLDVHVAYQALKEKMGGVSLSPEEWSLYIKGDEVQNPNN